MFQDIPGGLYVTKKVITSNSVSNNKDVFNKRTPCIDEMTLDDSDSDFKVKFYILRLE